jgi:hypothetical protein
MPQCECKSFEDVELTREAVNHRARQTTSLKLRLQLIAKHTDGEHWLFQCRECGQNWLRSLAWNWGNKEYLFRVPRIESDAWIKEPFVQPDELLIFASLLNRFHFEPSEHKCRRDGCAKNSVKLSAFCVNHHIQNLQKVGTFPQTPIGRWFVPYDATNFAVPS